MAQLLLVKLIADAIRNRGELPNLVIEMLSQHRFGRHHIPNRLIQPIKQLVADFIRLQSKTQKRDPNIDFSNFFKRDDLSRDAFRRCCAPKTTRMAALLARHIEGIN